MRIRSYRHVSDFYNLVCMCTDAGDERGKVPDFFTGRMNDERLKAFGIVGLFNKGNMKTILLMELVSALDYS